MNKILEEQIEVLTGITKLLSDKLKLIENRLIKIEKESKKKNNEEK